MNTNSTEVGRRGDRKRGTRRTFYQRRPTILQASTQTVVKYWASVTEDRQSDNKVPRFLAQSMESARLRVAT